LRILKLSLPALALLLVSAEAQAQAPRASIGGRPNLYVGGYYSRFDSDYVQQKLWGFGTFVDWDLFNRLGVEGEARFLRINPTADVYSDHYLIGPRYSRRYGRFRPYAKFLLGAGELNYPNDVAHGGYFAMAPGGGLDYRLTRHLAARADYEYQFWPTAPGLPGQPSNGLTPSGFSFGVGYRIF
jgi:opacity protein-like surface antigen